MWRHKMGGYCEPVKIKHLRSQSHVPRSLRVRFLNLKVEQHVTWHPV